jgi:hypothetical protein
VLTSGWCAARHVFFCSGEAIADAQVLSRDDAAPLAHHLEENSVEFIQFAFRWMNCLLMREMSVKNIVRMWDTYLVRPLLALSSPCRPFR